MKNVRLGDMLISDGLLTEEQVASALAHQEATGVKLGKALMELELITEDILLSTLSKQFDIPIVDRLIDIEVDMNIVSKINATQLVRYGFIPVCITDDNKLQIICSDIANNHIIELCTNTYLVEVEYLLAKEKVISDWLVDYKATADREVNTSRIRGVTQDFKVYDLNEDVRVGASSEVNNILKSS